MSRLLVAVLALGGCYITEPAPDVETQSPEQAELPAPEAQPDPDCVTVGVTEATVCALAKPWCEDACPEPQVYGDCFEACASELADCLEDAFEHAEECSR